MRYMLLKCLFFFTAAVALMILITMWTAFSQGDSSKIRWLEKVEAPDTRGAQEPAFNLREHPEIKNKLPSAKSGKSKILILAYTNFFIFEKWIKEDADECSLGQRKQCVLDKFEVTYDIERFMESDLVLFHARNMPMLFYLYFLSRTRPSFQRWVYVSWESPDATPDPEPLNSLFNLTWTYRSDADLWCPYGSYERLSPRDAKNYVKKTALTADFAKGKSKLVAWLVSNCESSLMRTSVVNELRNYIEVDVFGNCSTEFGQDRSCSNAVECLKDYKFYLSFENALCEDYITEKYWGRLGDENVVPVVLGGANYTRLAIPGSYINVMDFKTVKQLAEYLQYLDKNNTAYNEYFKWRRKFKVTHNDIDVSLCNICKSFNFKSPLKPKVYDDLRAYWVEKAKCNAKDYLLEKMIMNSNSGNFI